MAMITQVEVLAQSSSNFFKIHNIPCFVFIFSVDTRTKKIKLILH